MILLENWLKKVKNHFQDHVLFYIAVILFWVKAYAVQKLEFNLPVDGLYQEIILLMNPGSSILIMLAFGMVLFRKRQHIALVLLSFWTSFVLFANMVYYREFHDFITLPVMFQADSVGDLKESIYTLIYPRDFLVFLDTLILIGLVYWRRVSGKLAGIPFSRAQLVSVSMLAISLFLVNWTMAETVRPELLTRTFDRHIMVKSIGVYNYHLYDAVINSRMKTKKVFASSKDLLNAEEYLNMAPKDEINKELFGIAEGRNVFLVSLESLQTFVIDRKIDGHEITPFMNRLLRHEDSFYFDNFYHQVGQGKTSDSEFIIDNSLYPLPSGAVFFTHAQNTYNATPHILREKGYYSAVFHANDKSFWNRDLMYKALGYDRFYSVTEYEVTPENSVGWGLKDIPFFEQTVAMARELPQPFYTRLITLTNHHPFTLHEEDKFIPEYTSNSGTLNRYVVTVRYLDEALKRFFEEVRAAGLYDNSIFILYGDHYGISQNHNRAMAMLLEKEEITPFDHIQLQRVPLIIHIPGMEKKGGFVSKVSGQIDLRPTLLRLLGVEIEHGISFGHDMFAPNKPEFVVLRDGSFVTDSVVYTEGRCFDKATGEETEMEMCEPYMEKATQDLRFSDEIIYGDLMRFLLEDQKEPETSRKEKH